MCAGTTAAPTMCSAAACSRTNGAATTPPSCSARSSSRRPGPSHRPGLGDREAHPPPPPSSSKEGTPRVPLAVPPWAMPPTTPTTPRFLRPERSRRSSRPASPGASFLRTRSTPPPPSRRASTRSSRSDSRGPASRRRPTLHRCTRTPRSFRRNTARHRRRAGATPPIWTGTAPGPRSRRRSSPLEWCSAALRRRALRSRCAA